MRTSEYCYCLSRPSCPPRLRPICTRSVGDRVDIDGDHYVVKEMHLLSTVFRRIDGKIVQMPHSLLNAKVIAKSVISTRVMGKQ
jgi:hypothetical protein